MKRNVRGYVTKAQFLAISQNACLGKSLYLCTVETSIVSDMNRTIKHIIIFKT